MLLQDKNKSDRLEKERTPLPSLSTWPQHPLVSLLVAAWNEEENLNAFLNSYVALDYPNKELILCAGGDDSTSAIANMWMDRQITILKQKTGEGKFCALQRCLAYASGTIIMLADADSMLNAESFKQLICPIVFQEATVTTGMLQPIAAQKSSSFVLSQWSQMQYHLERSLARSNLCPFLLGQNSALIRSAVDDAYETSLPNLTGEDTYLALCVQKAGHSILRVPESYVETRFPENFWQYVRQRNRWRRDQLIQHHQAGNKRIMWKGLISVCKHLAWLLLPLCVFFVGYIGLFGWLFIWGYTFAGYIRRFNIGQKSIALSQGTPMYQGHSAVPILSLIKLMLADSCAVISLGIFIAIPALRYRW